MLSKLEICQMLEHLSFFLQLHLQDALTLTSRFCKPDLFITMTANPKWTEIQNQLPTGISPQSCPHCGLCFPSEEEEVNQVNLERPSFWENESIHLHD